jgi:hypothetical protein
MPEWWPCAHHGGHAAGGAVSASRPVRPQPRMLAIRFLVFLLVGVLRQYWRHRRSRGVTRIAHAPVPSVSAPFVPCTLSETWVQVPACSGPGRKARARATQTRSCDGPRCRVAGPKRTCRHPATAGPMGVEDPRGHVDSCSPARREIAQSQRRCPSGIWYSIRHSLGFVPRAAAAEHVEGGANVLDVAYRPVANLLQPSR